MAVQDLWHLTRPPKDSVPCGEHGQLVASGRHGRGKRYRVNFTDPAGKPDTEHFDKKGDAERFDVKVRGDIARGTYVDPNVCRITLQEYAEQWRAIQPHRPNTATNTRSRLKKHINPILGPRPLAAIRTSEIQAFVRGLELAPSSVRPVFETLRGILNAAVRDRILPFNPCAGVKLPELHTEEIVPLTVEQVRALTAAMAPRYRAFVPVGAGSGLRQAELFGLQVRDVDFLRRTLRVDRQVQPVDGGGVQVCPPKNKASKRVVPIARVVVEELAAHLAAYPAGPDEFIFRGARGQPIRRNTFNEGAWADAVTAAKLEDVTCHDLRHFYASALIRKGLNAKVVAARLGHADPAMTWRVYTHLWVDDEDRSREAIDDIFAEQPRLKIVEGGAS